MSIRSKGFERKRGRDNFHVSAIKESRRLFLDMPLRMRWNMKIPAWYSEEYGIPSFVLRTKYRLLTSRQKVLSTIARLYYIWIFNVVPVYETVPLNTASRVRASKCDGMSSLLWQAFHTKYWYGPAAKLFGKLKVLLRPIMGW